MRFLVFFSWVWMATAVTEGAASDRIAAAPPRVLVIYSQRRELPITQQWEAGIREGLAAQFGQPVAMDSEYVDVHRLKQGEEQQALLALMLSKYEAIPPAVVIAVHDGIAGLIVRQSVLPDVPVVFCSILERTRKQLPAGANLTGVLYRFDARRTVQCARSLIPSARKVVVVSGSGEADLLLLEMIREDLSLERDLPCEYWTGLPLDTLCNKVASLSSDHIVVFNSYMQDRGGEIATVPRDVLKRIASESSVPVFALYDTMLGAGAVGGYMPLVEDQGRLAGEMAGRILQGESPKDIPFSGAEMNRFVFDWRELRRWNLREQDLPSGSLVLFREPTVWERYGAYLVAGAVTAVLESLLIVALLVERGNRRRAKSELAERLTFETLVSELSSHFVQVKSKYIGAEIEHALMRVADHLAQDLAVVFLLSESADQLEPTFHGCRVKREREPFRDPVPLKNISWLWNTLEGIQAFPFSSESDWPSGATCERQLMRQAGLQAGLVLGLKSDGNLTGLLVLGQLKQGRRWDPDKLQRINLVAEVISSALARARIDEALRASRQEAQQLAGRILTAQEEERKRIARELHDDISQRLAAGAITAGKAEHDLSPPNPARAALADITKELVSLSEDVHRLSRRLHPAILEDLGLRDALAAECDRVAQRSELQVNYRCGPLPERVPRNIALCVYRVAQEAMHNVVRHAQSDRVEVTLTADLEFLNLEVHDAGCGFDPAYPQTGLGLASMSERVRLVGGEFSLASAPGEGTTICVRVPWPSDEPDSTKADTLAEVPGSESPFSA